MNIDLKGKKVIVTGGTRGLGYGLAGGLGRAGAELVIIGSSEKVHESARQLTADMKEKSPENYREITNRIFGKVGLENESQCFISWKIILQTGLSDPVRRSERHDPVADQRHPDPSSQTGKYSL